MPLTSPDGYLDFTNAVPRAVKMVATSNVGIGTSSPIYALDVHGTSNTGPLTVSSLTIANGAIEGDLNISGNLVYTSNTTTIVNSNVVVEYTGPHGRDPKEVPLKKYPEIVFAEGKFDANESTNTYVQAGYTVTASSTYSTYSGWKVFDGVSNVDTSSWYSGDNLYNGGTPVGTGSGSSQLDTNVDVGEYLVITLPFKIKASYALISPRTNGNYSPKSGKFYAYDGTNWVELSTFTNKTYTPGSFTKIDIDSTTFYEKFAIVSTEITATTSTYTAIGELQLYGYEEDPPAGDSSLDTTFTSIMNTPQTTGANVYVDAKLSTDFTNQVTGPTPTGTAATHNDTGKYWELTSNVTVEANTFLEGDAPHSVSVWFNSSNLEANVSNSCIFSLATEEKLDSVNLDLQSNTWHNLTYSYQGEGGSRVTYLDGRKVSEDQAEDTFGDYPPFAMTGYSQGGYVASTNNFYTAANNERDPWRAYDGLTNSDSTNCWGTKTGDSFQTSGEGLAQNNTSGNPDTFIDETGTLHTGHWNKIELPHKLQVDYISIYCELNDLRVPGKVAILGSNDDEKWYLLKDVTTNLDFTTVTPQIVPMENNKNKGFKYLILVVKTVPSRNGAVTIREISYYGHRENDLVRLPDPTRVLKYPHIALTGPAQRGYVASASDTHNTVITNNGGPWQAFDGTITQVTTEGWVSPNSRYSNDAAGSTAVNGVANIFNGRDGEWLNIKLPHKITLSSFETFVRIDRDHEHPTSGYLYASNDGFATFQEIYSFTDVAVPGEVNGKVTHVIPSSHLSVNLIPYNEYRIQATKLEGAAGFVSIAELKLYGTGVDSVPIQIGGGNIDRVANFRVYDKFVGEDQALEIWDAQKDEFGRAKSSMTLHKGRLGIGTTEPEGRLAVADEPDATTYGLQEFPPRAMGGNETLIEGHGVFKASASRESLSSQQAYEAFDEVINVSSFWDSRGGTDQYSESTGDYIGSDITTTIDGGQISGTFIQLEMPYKVKLQSISIMPQKMSSNDTNFYGGARMPKTGSVVGSNDGVNWYLIASIGQTAYSDGMFTPFQTASTTFYSYFRLIAQTITQGANSTWRNRFNLSGFKLFGYREQVTKQSVLHDGQLTLTKNLTVPRIGPALDADDTPRRDRLVVEYNTSSNPTFEGAVRDTSGRGNDGVFYGGASYSATEKAFTFDGSGDYIEGPVHNSTGEWLHSVSMWFKRNASDSYDVLFHLGKQSAGKTSSMRLFSDNRFRFNFYDGDIEASYTVNNGTWYHLAFSYSGGTDIANRKIYLNGVELTVTNVSGTPVVLNLDANEMFTLATQRAIIEGQMNCDISNFKLYDCALTAQEVKTLYDMGRCDEGHHMVNFSKTRVGIGLGDGEAPRGALDVRGDVITKASIGVKNVTNPISPVDIRNTVLYNGEAGASFNPETMGAINIRHGPGNDYSMWNITCHDNNDLYFLYNTHTSSTPPNWGVAGYLMDNSAQAQLTFTGQHRTFIKDIPFSQVSDLEGLIVSSDQNKYIKLSGGIEAGSNAITINESLPVVSLSTTTNDKKCFGVISASEDPEKRSDVYGSFVTPFEKEKGDTRVYINSVGEGAIWVSNIGGNLEAGDYITTSNVAGYGQKQTDDILHNYTVAKITMDCDFEPVTQPVQQILRSNVVETYYLGNVHHTKTVPHEFVTTTVGADDTWSNVSVSPSDVTYAEWSNLEANTQNTYTLTYTQTSNVVYDTKYTLTTTANVTESDPWDRVSIDPPDVTYAEYSNLEANTQNTYTLTFTQTTTDEKTPEEWSALESNVQSLYNKVYYQSVEEEVAATWPGAVAHTRVTDRIENELDEHGQIQWEDHPTETEKAYKIRYLDVSGAQTDEANAVHIAAFVGCTYHCG